MTEKVRLIFTDDDLWVYPAGKGDIHYTTLVGANLDVESLTMSVDRMEEIRSKFDELDSDLTWHDMRGREVTEPDVAVYDTPDDFLGDFLSPQWPPPD